MKRQAAIIGLVLALGPRCAAAAADEVPLGQQVLWRHRGSGEPLFLPQPALVHLQKTNAEGGRLPKATASAVGEALRGFQRHSALFPACAQPPVVDAGEEPPAAAVTSSLLEVVRTSETAVIGEVTNVVPGWGVPYMRVVSLVEMVVRRVLADSAANPLVPGEHISYIQNSGELRLGNERACSEDYAGFAAARRGDTILLIGFVGGDEPHHIERQYVFPIRDGVVAPQPYRQVTPEGMSVDALQRAVTP
jgi:hypothetical protein